MSNFSLKQKLIIAGVAIAVIVSIVIAVKVLIGN